MRLHFVVSKFLLSLCRLKLSFLRPKGGRVRLVGLESFVSIFRGLEVARFLLVRRSCWARHVRASFPRLKVFVFDCSLFSLYFSASQLQVLRFGFVV